MQRHNLLTDDIFKNSKYMKVFNETFCFKDFRKESRKKESKYFGQYDLILNIFQTFIKVFNCFHSDSNKSKADKVEEARTIIEKFIYRDYENSQKHQYSSESIKNILDKRARRLYKNMELWLKDLKNISIRNIESNIILNQILETIEKEMKELEYVEFDSIVNDNIIYQKNNVKNYKDYKKYISKFDLIYSKRDEFINEFKEKYYKRTRINLTDDDIEMYRKVFTTITYGNNGLINIINSITIDTNELNEKSSDKDFYKAYLKLNGINYESDNYKNDTKAFSVVLQSVYKKAEFCLSGNLINCFDMLMFLITCEQVILTDEIKFDFVNNDINGILLDLKDTYNILKHSKMTLEELRDDAKKYNEEVLIPAYLIIKEIIERNKEFFMEIS